MDGLQTQRWILESSQCPEMSMHRLARIGIDHASYPYERVRLLPRGSFILASLEGEGVMRLEGKWETIKQGELCLAPPRVLNAFHVAKGKTWKIAWLRYDEPSSVKPLVGTNSPLRLAQGAERFGRILEEIQAEWEGFREPSMMHHWLSLLQGLVHRHTSPRKLDARLLLLWKRVEQELQFDWKLSSLAELACMSEEHLRRLCLKEYGRTPMEQVTYLRIQRARFLLDSTNEKLEALASEVGYHSSIVFSRAFFRCVGVLPSVYRKQKS